jgi:hypothetical protein
MADISVKLAKEKNAAWYEVDVKDRISHMRYRVTLSEDLYEKLTKGKMSREDCIRSAFRFLLDREPKEAILTQFDLSLISRYFMEFEDEFAKYSKQD